MVMVLLKFSALVNAKRRLRTRHRNSTRNHATVSYEHVPYGTRNGMFMLWIWSLVSIPTRRGRGSVVDAAPRGTLTNSS